jgi:ferredoxin-NADP reductase
MLGLLASAWHHWFLDRHAEFWAQELKLPSRTHRTARIVEVIDETADTKSFVLAPDRKWPGHRAGQFVPVEAEVDGVRVRRCYSISSGASAPREDRVTITVKRVAGGKLSNWLHDHARPGTVVTLGEPAGEFVVPDHRRRPVLFVAGGSGITPVIAILRDLEQREELEDVALIHVARGDADAIFGREFESIAHANPGFQLIAHRDAVDGMLDATTLHTYAPYLGARDIYVCGPPGLVDLVIHTGEAAGATVRHERFVAPPRRPRLVGAPALVQLRGRNVTLPATQPLLFELEGAGERPAHGCRMDICNSCRCKKVSGTVEDVTTGAVSSEPNEEIRLCMSIARSDLELAL